jgi:hypothetical protein
MGMTRATWRGVAAQTSGVDAPYRHRAAVLAAMRAVNSAYAYRERRHYAEAVAATELAGPPTFVIGHWRSGTTMLHNLLALVRRWASPTAMQAGFPETFILAGRLFPTLTRPFVPPQRPMDSVRFGLGRPQEDEFATAIASGCSPLLSQVFPRDAAHFDRFLTLEDAAPEERERWAAALSAFLKKLTLAEGKPLLLKSPEHAARIPHLLRLYPEARFVFIARDPFDVYRSTWHLERSMTWHTCLQVPDVVALRERMMRRYQTLMRAYTEARTLVGPGRLCEVRFEAVRDDPVRTLRGIYRTLGIDGFERHLLLPLRHRLSTHRAYRANRHQPLSGAVREEVAERWHLGFEAFGYEAASPEPLPLAA